MRFIVSSEERTVEFLEAGTIEEIREICEIFKDYSYRFSAEEKSVFERMQNTNNLNK